MSDPMKRLSARDLETLELLVGDAEAQGRSLMEVQTKRFRGLLCHLAAVEAELREAQRRLEGAGEAHGQAIYAGEHWMQRAEKAEAERDAALSRVAALEAALGEFAGESCDCAGVGDGHDCPTVRAWNLLHDAASPASAPARDVPTSRFNVDPCPCCTVDDSVNVEDCSCPEWCVQQGGSGRAAPARDVGEPCGTCGGDGKLGHPRNATDCPPCKGTGKRTPKATP